MTDLYKYIWVLTVTIRAGRGVKNLILIKESNCGTWLKRPAEKKYL